MPEYALPQTLASALSTMAAGGWRVLAGGTDFYPAQGARPITCDVLDISAIAGLRGIERRDGAWRIGALTTWTDLLRAELPPLFDGLKLAAREVGSEQIQHVASIAGNLCNASPAADGVPPLLALDAEVELATRRGRRRLPVGSFILGNRLTALAPDELMTAIWVPGHRDQARTHFVKLGARKYSVISIAMVAVLIELDAAATITQAQIAVGSCSVSARRLASVEAKLRGSAGIAAAVAAVDAQDLLELEPIDDVRSTAAYRREAAAELIRRALTACLSGDS